MNKLHAKSTCCRGQVIRFGCRRRQCSVCKKTWRIRVKKTGRKAKRVSENMALAYFKHEIPSLLSWSRKLKQKPDLLEYKLKQSRKYLLKKVSFPALPTKGPLVALADAMVQYLDGTCWTFYIILIKNTEKSWAFLTMPHVRKGTETVIGWKEAFQLLPTKTFKAIRVLVSDGHAGLVNLAKNEGWLLQRCHFHLIARLQSRRSKWRLSRHRKEGIQLYKLVRQVLTNPKEEEIYPVLESLKSAGERASSWELKTTLLGFCRHYQDFRTYLNYPEFNLPRTNNALESLIGSIRAINRRARGFRTIGSLTEWVVAFLKSKQKVTCRGVYQPS